MKIAVAFVCIVISSVIPAAFSQNAPDSIKLRLVSDWIRIHESVREYIEAMPEDGVNFKPTSDARSFAEAMLHIAQANFNMSSSASGLTNPYDYLKSRKSIESMDQFKTKTALKATWMKVLITLSMQFDRFRRARCLKHLSGIKGE